jgi:hypothetical protein
MKDLKILFFYFLLIVSKQQWTFIGCNNLSSTGVPSVKSPCPNSCDMIKGTCSSCPKGFYGVICIMKQECTLNYMKPTFTIVSDAISFY